MAGSRRGGAFEISQLRMLGHVHLRGVHRHRDLIGLGVELGQHVAGVVAQPLGGSAFRLRRKADRAAHLDHHLGHGLAHAGDQLVELGQALAALAVELAHVQVQHGGAGVVAVHRLLDLRFHRDGDVLGKVGGQPARRIGSGGDDERLLVLGEQVSVEEIHCMSPVSSGLPRTSAWAASGFRGRIHCRTGRQKAVCRIAPPIWHFAPIRRPSAASPTQ